MGSWFVLLDLHNLFQRRGSTLEGRGILCHICDQHCASKDTFTLSCVFPSMGKC